MNAGSGAAGATRTCPHCKTEILESSSICPSCKHYLRYDATPAEIAKAAEKTTALQVEGTIRHPADGGGAWEYSVVLVIRDDLGNEVKRQVVGVGAMHPNEERTFSLAVEVMPTSDMRRAPKRGGTRH